MAIQIFGKNKCFDTKKAERWFKERGIPFQRIDLAQRMFSPGELRSVIQALGGVDALLDPRAKNAPLFRALALEEDKIEHLLSDPGLIRTPVVRCGKQAACGDCPEAWQRFAGKNP